MVLVLIEPTSVHTFFLACDEAEARLPLPSEEPSFPQSCLGVESTAIQGKDGWGGFSCTSVLPLIHRPGAARAHSAEGRHSITVQ